MQRLFQKCTASSGSSALTFTEGPVEGYLVDPHSFQTDEGRDKATHSLAEWAAREYLIEKKRWDSVSERRLAAALEAEELARNPPNPRGALQGHRITICRASPTERKWIMKEIERCGGFVQDTVDAASSHLLVWQKEKVS